MDHIQATNLTLSAASKLSHSELLRFPSATLSALFLSLLQRAELHQQDRRSSFECILALQSQSSEIIASAIRFLSTISIRDIRKIPAIDLSEASIANWLINSRAAIAQAMPASSFNKPSASAPTQATRNKGNGIIHKSLSPETREQARNLLNVLISANLIPSKVVGLFRSSIKGENLIYTNDALRRDLISYLEKYQTTESEALIAIYKVTASNRTVQERIVFQQLESETESASDSFVGSTALAIKKMSISETIAWRKAQLEREQARNEAKQAELSETKNLILELSEELEQEENEIEETYAEDSEEVEELYIENFEFLDNQEQEQEQNSQEYNDEFPL